MTVYSRPTTTRDLKTRGRVILAEGEVTGHVHEVVDTAAPDREPTLPAADFFEEPDGRRVLLVTRPCLLTHQEHAPIALDPAHPVQVRQGDVLLQPISEGAWAVIRQREYEPAGIRNVAD
jgi:hypothetical protein